MDKIGLIKKAISDATEHKSKLSKQALEVPGFTSIKIRHLLNNLGSFSKKYLEIGSHIGSHFCSVLYENKISNAVAIDNYSEFNKSGETKESFLNNAETFAPK